MKLDPSQQQAIDLMQSGKNVFLTGLAGTGKSTVVTEYLASAFQPVEITATTGIAAINLQDAFAVRAGVTLKASTVYRWAGMGIGPKEGQEFADFFRELESNMYPARMAAFNRIRKSSALLIDEISMLPGRTLDYLEYHLRAVRENSKPFGGMQIIAVGDFLQLPPVSKSGVYDWAFLSDAWKKAEFKNCCLQKIHRQREPEFIDALNDFREGRIRGTTAALLSKRVAMFPGRNVTRLLTHNTQVNKWNGYQLECIDAPEVTFRAELSGAKHETDYLLKNMITPEVLKLKLGARVMVTRNIADGGDLIAANGATGTVNEIMQREAVVSVRLDSGKLLVLEKHTWHFDPNDQTSSSVSQIPLRLSYAMTIHKSQGLSLNSALIDIRAAREPGQAYVALSRLRSLEGLLLRGWIKGVYVSPEAIKFHRSIT